MKKISTIIFALMVMISPVMASDRAIFDDEHRINYSELAARSS